MDNHNAYIEMVGITKTFGKVIANHDINLKVEKGEIHALLGENGAGKSTLMNMLSGIYTPDKGEIYLDGQLISFSSPKDSIQAGIGMVHQHFKVIDVMTAAGKRTFRTKRRAFIQKRGNRQNIRDFRAVSFAS